MKKLLSVIVGIAFSLCIVNICSAERVYVYSSSDSHYYIDDSYVKIRRIQNTRKNAVRHGKEYGEPQYGLVVFNDVVNSSTGKLRYSHIYLFFKASDGKWCSTMLQKDYLAMNKISVETGELVYKPGGNKSYDNVYKILEKALEYVDVNSIPNTEAVVNKSYRGNIYYIFEEVYYKK